jgi:rare lipoprotein A
MLSLEPAVTSTTDRSCQHFVFRVTTIPSVLAPSAWSSNPCTLCPRVCRRRSLFLVAGVTMRSLICTVGLAAGLLITASARAHSRDFAWFFAHSRPHGACSGQHVVASYYNSGRRTASGQVFSRDGYTAAHRTLPFGSRVTVTNADNGRSVTVVINDRGPFTRGVTLDLAFGAARAIGMTRTQWVCMN